MRKPQKLVINWRAIPFVRLTLPFLLGIVSTQYFSIPFILANCLLIASIFGLYYYRHGLNSYKNRWIPGAVIYSAFVIIGCNLGMYYQALNQSNHFQQFLSAENYLIGTVQTEPKFKNGKFQLELATQLISEKGKKLSHCNGKILLYLRSENDSTKIEYGDQILFKSKIQRIEEAKNPNAFDYKSYLHFQNIHYQSFVKSDYWKVVKSAPNSTFSQKILALRTKYLEVFRKNIATENESAIAAALILGYKEDLSDDLKAAYAESGAIHVLAVSGLHVGIVSSLLLFFLNLISSKKKYWKIIKLALILMAIWGFALLTGLPTSVQRAAIMFTVLHSGRIIDRENNAYNSLAIAAFIILWMNPYAVFEVGFQFSFLAVMGILFFFPKLRKLYSPKNKFVYYLWQLTVVGISAQITVLPLSLYYFHQFPTYFLLTGLFVIPFAMLILYGGLGLLFVSLINDTLATWAGELLSWIIYLQNFLIGCIQSIPFHLIEGFWLNGFEVILLYLFILFFSLRLIVRNLKYTWAALCSLLLVSCMQVQKVYQSNVQQQIAIYSLNKHTAIDFMDGDKVYAFTSENIPEKTLIYTIKNNRIAAGIKEIIPAQELDNIRNEATNFYKKRNYIQFYKKRIVLVNQALPKRKIEGKKLECDYIIVQKNPRLTMSELLAVYRTKEIIFDGSNSNYAIEKWKEECGELGITAYKDIRKDGAYVINLKTIKTRPFIEIEEDNQVEDMVTPTEDKSIATEP